ncbi:cytochrome P450 [Planctomicrobium piriforme]|uniref:Cytochrome P450 n=1 Tax=Planctomicrobium piriforme TaxID=1576369 RepID=A0A1I3I7L4_9PLAN|nr:cytochrome P450 [Planctomicrobium piriforme]SFI44005.1 Cytochrome P450 [Planctomicrobium piriforme]
MNTLPFSAVNNSLPVTHGRISDFADDPVVCMRNLWRTHGEVAALQEGSQRIHFVFGPTYTKQVLSDSQRFHSQFFAIRGPRKSAQRRVTSGLMTMNGDTHKQHRRIVMGPFQKRAITAYHDTVVQMADQYTRDWKPGEVRDLTSEMTQYMLQLTSSLLFGIDLPRLAYRVGELTERWVAMNHQVGPAAFSSDASSTEEYEQLLAAAEELEAAVQEMINIRRSGKLGFDVLSLLIRAHEEESGVTDEQLIGHIVLLFGAAHLTSAHTLTWTLFLLAQHPEVMTRLHAEFQQTLDGKSPRPEDLERMPYLERVLKESMRVLPASGYSQRIAAETVDLGPFQLQRGAAVIFSQFITHHMPELYSQPEQFLPDRWETINPSPYAYLPFGAGPRMCVGAALGMMQLKISLPMILNRFKLSMVPNSEVNGRVMSTMLFPTSTVPVLLSEHDGQFESAPVSGSIHSLIDLPAKSKAKIWAA